MEKSILSNFQKEAVSVFKKSGLAKSFYLGGGTALAEYYLKHRKSEDLDFFTEEDLNLASLKNFSSKLSKAISIDKVEFQDTFGLYTFFYSPKGEVAKYKIDFGQYPFVPIEKPKLTNGLKVEGLFDIAVDKAQTISSRPRSRDFIDLYFVLHNKPNWSFELLCKKAQEKFEIIIDPIQLGQNLLLVKSLSDMPIMLKEVNIKLVQKYFLNEAEKLRCGVFGT